MGLVIYRIQDKDGRGPYRPGYSRNWTDESHENRNPPITAEFDALAIIQACKHSGFHYGCGFREIEQLERWFNFGERIRLKSLGFLIVKLNADRILAGSARQLIFARKKALKYGIESLPWVAAAA